MKNHETAPCLKMLLLSRIIRFHMKSELAKQILSYDQDAYLKRNGHKCPIIVLQVMLCGDQELLAEIMWKDDFDKLFVEHDKKERTYEL